MSDTLDFDDDDSERGQRKASVAQVASYIWRLWASQPGKLAWFAGFFLLATACDLALPFASAQLVEALANGPTAPGARQAAWGFGLFTAIAFVFHFARNVGVRFWIPFAANNMQAIVADGFRDVQRFSADWHADNFAGATVRRVSRAMWAYDAISVWFVLPAAFVLVSISALTALQWPLIGLFTGVTIVVFLVSSYFMAVHYMAAATRASNAADTHIGAALADAIGSNATVKAFGAEAREQARFEGVAKD